MNTIQIPLDSARELRDLLTRILKEARLQPVELKPDEFWKLVEREHEMRHAVMAAEADAMVDAQEYVKEAVGV